MAASLVILWAAFAADAGPPVYQTNLRLATVPALYRDSSSRVTNTHEATHGLNSQLRQQYQGRACYYIGRGRFLTSRLLTSPTLGQVAARVRYRGRVAGTYLDLARLPLQPETRVVMGTVTLVEGHERNPTFLFDELAAYTNGAEVAEQYEPVPSELTHALELAHYAATLVWALPAGQDQTDLARIWVFQAARLEQLAMRARQRQCYESSQDGWLAELRRERRRLTGAR